METGPHISTLNIALGEKHQGKGADVDDWLLESTLEEILSESQIGVKLFICVIA